MLFPEILDDDPLRDNLLRGYTIATRLRIYSGLYELGGGAYSGKEAQLKRAFDQWKVWVEEFGHLLNTPK